MTVQGCSWRSASVADIANNALDKISVWPINRLFSEKHKKRPLRYESGI